jgi:hypothetical protein
MVNSETDVVLMITTLCLFNALYFEATIQDVLKKLAMILVTGDNVCLDLQIYRYSIYNVTFLAYCCHLKTLILHTEMR